mgnify:CR=1 FL=1
MGAAREPEIVAGGYEIDMADLPKVHFAEHPEWEELYDAAWESHKSNIRKARAVLNPEEPYYVDEAFSDMIFVWDTLLMMMFDKYGIHQFPTLQAMDNFYYWQVDNPGQPDDASSRVRSARSRARMPATMADTTIRFPSTRPCLPGRMAAVSGAWG